MKKELLFIGLLEWREPHSFIVPPERLIRIPVNEKTTCHTAYKELRSWLDGIPNGEEALEFYLDLVGHVHYKVLFFKQQMFVPEPGSIVFAMFNLRSVK